jgi:tRNA nucleotidyltransferase (CCA-adding enzyme)
VLGKAGHRAWLVGGCVRDLALGQPVNDLDLVSAATPDEVQQLFPRTVAVGKAFGVMRVLIGDFEFEVATFRSEGDYSDGRRPNEVRLVSSAETDATRRDFTCNALYLDPLDGTRLDPTHGLRDLEAKILRTVGDAGHRFQEDSLRLLRMARFEAGLDLTPVEGLHGAARAAGEGLQRISPERVLDELTRIAGGPDPARALGILLECDLWQYALPALIGGDDQLRLGTLEELARGAGMDASLVLAIFLDPDSADPAALLDSLPLSRELRRRLLGIWQARLRIEELARAGSEDRADLARALRGTKGARGLALAQARCRANGEDPEGLDRLASWAADATMEVEPLLTGNDLEQLGVERGPRIGALLKELETEQLRGTVGTVAEARALVQRVL